MIQEAILTSRQLIPVPAGAVYYIPVTAPLIANAPPPIALIKCGVWFITYTVTAGTQITSICTCAV